LFAFGRGPPRSKISVAFSWTEGAGGSSAVDGFTIDRAAL
jgi:hypothetical protein